jgi:biotin synthase
LKNIFFYDILYAILRTIIYKEKKMNGLIEKLKNTSDLTDSEFNQILSTDIYDKILAREADIIRRKYYNDSVYLRGLIEFTNYCKNNCLYCGIRCSNKNLRRYRLTENEILDCCRVGHALGYRTFVLQGGEDNFYTDEILCDIIFKIKNNFPDCAITLSIGEKSKESYKKYFNAGAERYLLRHETANNSHYKKIHPDNMNPDNRKRCLFNLKEIGYQIGTGIMVQSPFQTVENIIEDLRFMQELQPDMIGIGPFISHEDTPFKDFENGTLEMTLRLISLLRLCFPKALIPATTALGTINPIGRELGLMCGANVVMPNLSPKDVRKFYSLYDNKICTGEEAAECRGCLERRINNAGYRIVESRGDSLSFENKTNPTHKE